MNALIVGLGSIGTRHLRNLRQLAPACRITVWRQHTRPGIAGAVTLADRVVYSLEEAMEAKPEAALITSPATRHIETGLMLAQRGVHLFIEKPVSHTLDGVDDLLDVCHRSGLTLMVGYHLRFYAPLQRLRQALHSGRIGRPLSLRAEAGQYLPDWRPGRDYRRAVSARRDLGGGAVLELSHELDYARWLMGEVSAVSAMLGRVGDLEIDVEDIAEITLRFASGAIGNIHLDLLQRAATRTCRIIGTEGTLVWDGLAHRVQLFSAETKTWEDIHPARDIPRDEVYIAELRHFLDCVEGRQTPLVTGMDGRRALEIALAAKRSAEERRTIEL